MKGLAKSEAQLAEAMQEMDHNGSGSVDFQEFEQCASPPLRRYHCARLPEAH